MAGACIAVGVLLPIAVRGGSAGCATGHGWGCNWLYVRSGPGCAKIIVPDHAELDYSGHKWHCFPGYRPVGDHCI